MHGGHSARPVSEPAATAVLVSGDRCRGVLFDEIHSYDARLFGSLLRYLQTFPGLPVLLMSASIPPGRMVKLREVLGERAGGRSAATSKRRGIGGIGSSREIRSKPAGRMSLKPRCRKKGVVGV